MKKSKKDKTKFVVDIWSILPEAGAELVQAGFADEERPPATAEIAVCNDRDEYPQGVACINIDGAILTRSYWDDDVTAKNLIAQFRALESDPTVETVVLRINSPGGAITGVSELAQLIRRSPKRTLAYIDGVGASAAYWIASAADEIFVADTAIVGSIGTMMRFYKSSNNNIITITNTDSPNKDTHPETKAGRAEIVRVLNQAAEVFIAAVAAGRKTSVERVKRDFGKGAVFGARDALAVGMVDGIMPFFEVFERIDTAASKKVDFSAETSKSTLTMKSITTSQSSEPTASEDITNQEGAKMPNLSEVVGGDAALRAEYKVKLADERAAGEAAAKERYTRVLAVAGPVLESDAYPQSIKALAVAVLRGDEEPAALRGALAALDALKAQNEDTAAKADSVDADVTPATPPTDVNSLSTDGMLRSAADIEAEHREFWGEEVE